MDVHYGSLLFRHPQTQVSIFVSREEPIVFHDSNAVGRGDFGSATKDQVRVFCDLPYPARAITSNRNGSLLEMAIDSRHTELMPVQSFNVHHFVQIVVPYTAILAARKELKGFRPETQARNGALVPGKGLDEACFRVRSNIVDANRRISSSNSGVSSIVRTCYRKNLAQCAWCGLSFLGAFLLPGWAESRSFPLFLYIPY
mmetsp:Transcript_18542/g.45948  ORF Transcript_18542/g.45948 Transcript_18542/m.45948 type:complete len:200 (-) Transcript_18542:67-666(-)